MKKILFPLVGVLLLCTGCDRVKQYFHKLTSTEDVMAEKSVGALQFKHVLYCSPDSVVITEADLPLLDGSVLGDSVFLFLESEFPGLTDAYIEGNTDLEEAFKRMGHDLYKNITMQIDEMKSEDDGMPEYMFAWTFEKHVTVACDMPHYLTYVYEASEYTGGAHGMSYAFGVTFDKETGQRIDESILKNANDPEFRALLLNGLLEYFIEDDPYTGDSLEDYLLIDVDELELGNISLTDKGVVIKYQLYEIAPYSAGMPEVNLTFDQIKPFLSQKGLALIGD